MTLFQVKTAPHLKTVVDVIIQILMSVSLLLGPILDEQGNGGKGINWDTQVEVDFLKELNYTKTEGAAEGRPLIESAIDAAEVILSLAPETNGQVAVKAWAALSEKYWP